MASLLLLPGYGGAYNSASLTSTSTEGADVIDCTRCEYLSVQLNSNSSAITTGSIQLKQTFNGINYRDFGAPINVETMGAITLFSATTTGPFGRLNIDPTSISHGSLTVTITGF